MNDLSRLSLNQITIKQWTLAQAIEGCARHGLGHIGIWRDKLAEQPIQQTVRQLNDTGIKVSSLIPTSTSAMLRRCVCLMVWQSLRAAF